MDLYSQVTEVIAQNGRRAAMIIIMDVSHPDIEEFIDIKQDLNRVTKANISIKITDEFMNAVKNDEEFDLKFTRKETGEEKVKTIKARDLYRKIAQSNFDMGEPGMLFWDRVNNYSLLSDDDNYVYAGVNPCGEQCLPAFGACLLGSINLSAFVKNPFTDFAYFDFDEFRDTVRKTVNELNIILDEGIPSHPLEGQKETATNWRQIGLGVMSISDMLIKMRIRYGSDKSLDLCDKISFEMANTAIDKSADLSKDYGPYPNYNEKAIFKSQYFIRNTTNDTKEKVKKYGLRNSHLLTIAPTGSLSNVLGVSGGIEPIFANSYTRRTQTLHENGDTYYKVYTPIVKEYMEAFGIENEEDLPDYFVTASQIPYEERIRMQATWQRHIDVSISSTVNLPESATVEDIEDLYMKAWENGLKGITVFRDNCKRVGILTTDKKEEEKTEETGISNENILSDSPEPVSEETIGLARGEVVKVSNDVVGLKRKLMTGCGSLHCTAFFDKKTGDMVETYLSKGSTGGCNNFMVGLSRMISLAARGGISIYDIVDQLKSTGSCPSYAVRRAVHKDTSVGSCCPMAVGNALLDMYEEFNKLGKYAEKKVYEKPSLEFIEAKPKHLDYISKNSEESTDVKVNIPNYKDKSDIDLSSVIQYREEALCPQCHSVLDHEGGCDICRDCGYTKCD